MKTNYLYLLLCFISIILGGCKDDAADNPLFGDDEIPYIYTDMLESANAIAGEETEFKVYVSPADEKTAVKWYLDSEVIGTEATLVYTFPEAGTFRLRIEVTRNGLLNYRNFNLTVTEPAEPEEPEDPGEAEEPEEPAKQLNKNVFCYLNAENLNRYSGSGRTIPWEKMTHLIITNDAAMDGTVSAASGIISANSTLIQEGQGKGVKVLISMNLGNYKTQMDNTSNAATLAAAAIQAVNSNNLDGVNVVFEGWAESSSGGSDKPENATYLAFLKELYQQLRNGMSGKLVTASVKGYSSETYGAQKVYNDDYSLFDNIDYLNVIIWQFAGAWTDACQHASLEHFTTSATIWETTGIDKEKIILGVPAYGIEFTGATKPYTTAPARRVYRDILTTYTDDPANHDELVQNGKYLYYNGKPLVGQKADYVVSNDFGGIVLNELWYDSDEEDTSLLQVIYEKFTE